MYWRARFRLRTNQMGGLSISPMSQHPHGPRQASLTPPSPPPTGRPRRGRARSDDGVLDVALVPPKVARRAAARTGTNPEQLFRQPATPAVLRPRPRSARSRGARKVTNRHPVSGDRPWFTLGTARPRGYGPPRGRGSRSACPEACRGESGRGAGPAAAHQVCPVLQRDRRQTSWSTSKLAGASDMAVARSAASSTTQLCFSRCTGASRAAVTRAYAPLLQPLGPESYPQYLVLLVAVVGARRRIGQAAPARRLAPRLRHADPAAPAHREPGPGRAPARRR